MIEINNFGWVFLQLLLGFLVLFILYIATLVILSIDSLVVYPSFIVKQREEAVIVSKPLNSAVLAKSKYNTIFPFKKDFVKIPQSVNGTTGSQFTYQFWMKVNNNEQNNFKDLVLLLKGDTKKYKVGYYDMESKRLMEDKTEPSDYMIKSPLIKFKDSYKNMVVEFNTNNHPNVKINIDLDKGDDETRRKNLLSLLPLDWFMFTFVFEENYSMTEGSENGIRFTFYMNDIPVQINSGSTDVQLRNNFLKQNDGDLFILPNFESKIDILSLSNVKYFNYAKSDTDVRADFQRRSTDLGQQIRSQNLYTSI
jgi:hypothetical protein